jgi:hypothetical protein
MPNRENANQYARVAKLAYQLIVKNKLTAKEAWNKAAEEEIDNLSSRVKNCPRETFIGLCDSGKLKNISKKKISESRNYDYAVFAISEWKKDEFILKNDLWKKIYSHFGFAKNHQGQLDVLEGLWEYLK